MDLLITILIGLAIGLVVELMLPGHTGCEFVLAMLLGVAGALLARHVGLKAGWFGTRESSSFIAAGAGAVGVLILYALFFRKRNSGRR